ncbi:SET domain-containing protein [Macrolepiota fuliginosa MF-IS2]|uniref:SET domain-containing protein n=1 Tax=Macrolepiota fuliginosa MF-IS2 TaxID=1400762 RepID=A0A9P5X359_9AGAR|nr:SET domain-containing protein [Macrolepiota fuliginosa MF-IS2]
MTLCPPKYEEIALERAETTKPPPTPVCADINNQIRHNPAHNYPDFDFAAYMRYRSYTLSTFNFGGSTCACFLDNGVHGIVANLAAQFPSTPSPTTPSFKIRDAKDKGLGVFATTSIPSRGTVFIEHPTIITPYLLGVSVPLAEMYTELFETLPKPAFALATSLTTLHQDSPKTKPSSQVSSLPPPSFYEDLMQTNSVAIDLQVPCDVPHREIVTHRALFLLLSRCNHSCNPNAAWSWDSSTLTLSLTALRPISPGDEVTISYIPPSPDHTMRQRVLQNAYGFDCTCEACTLPPYEANSRNTANIPEKSAIEEDNCDSDSDESAVYCLLPTFEEWCADPTLPDHILINAHKNALYEIELQNLHSLQSTPSIPTGATAQAIDHHVEAIAMCYGALGDVMNFRKWIAIAKEARVRSGAHREQKIVFNRWLSNPSSFPVWDSRKPY